MKTLIKFRSRIKRASRIISIISDMLLYSTIRTCARCTHVRYIILCSSLSRSLQDVIISCAKFLCELLGVRLLFSRLPRPSKTSVDR